MHTLIIALAFLFFVGMGTGFLPAFWRASGRPSAHPLGKKED